MRYDNVFGVDYQDLCGPETTKKEGPQEEEPRKRLQLHYTQAKGIRQDTRGLYLVGRSAPIEAAGRR